MFKPVNTKFIRTSTILVRGTDQVVFSSRTKGDKSLPSDVANALCKIGGSRLGDSGRYIMTLSTYAARFADIEQILSLHTVKANKDAVAAQMEAQAKAEAKMVAANALAEAELKAAQAKAKAEKREAFGKLMSTIISDAIIVAGYLLIVAAVLFGIWFLTTQAGIVILGLLLVGIALGGDDDDLVTGFIFGKFF